MSPQNSSQIYAHVWMWHAAIVHVLDLYKYSLQSRSTREQSWTPVRTVLAGLELGFELKVIGLALGFEDSKLKT